MKNLKGLFSGFLALVFYAVENVVIQIKLSEFAPERITTYFYIGAVMVTLCLTPVALILRDQFGIDLAPVSLKVFGIIIICIAVEIVADFFYFKAYHEGASIATVSTLVSFLPVMAVLLEAIVKMEMISLRQFSGCLLVPVVVYLVSGK